MAEEENKNEQLILRRIKRRDYRSVKVDGASMSGPLGTNKTYAITYFVDSIDFSHDVLEDSGDGTSAKVVATDGRGIREEVITIIADRDSLLSIYEIMGRMLRPTEGDSLP